MLNFLAPKKKPVLASLVMFGLLSGLGGCATPSTADSDQAARDANCLVPGQVRRVGGRAMLSARQAVEVSQQECGQLGGQLISMSD